VASIRTRLASTGSGVPRHLWGRSAGVSLTELKHETALSVSPARLAGRSVLIAARDQFAAGLSLIELDGIARRLIISTPDITPVDLAAIIDKADVDAIVSDRDLGSDEFSSIRLRVCCGGVTRPADAHPAGDSIETEWILLTSGTTGTPKLVVHSFESLTAPIGARTHYDEDVVWGTFYDIRRYGGLQMFLRFLLGRGSMVVGGAGETQADYLTRLGQRRVSHLTGTPTHWRRALMCPEAHLVAPRYVRLSGEIADQGILNALHAFFPNATIGHAFASTEAGVGFEVNDGLEGFPVSLLNANPDVQMKVEDGSLLIRSSRNAGRYLGEGRLAIGRDDGFVDTGDLVEQRGDRFYFLGRRTGVINVGGNKVHPEEVESVINRHPAVRMSVVKSKRNPIMGALVIADVVLTSDAADNDQTAVIKREIVQICRANLAAHKIPVTIRFVPALDVAAAGKLARHES